MLARSVDRLAVGLTILACLVCLMMMLHVTADVIGRTVFNRPLNGTTEIVSAWYMVALAFLPLGWITRERGHIIVELFTGRMSAANLDRLDLAVAIVSFGYMALFIWQAVVVALDKTAIAEAWEAATGFVPIWPSRWVVVIGSVLMAVYLIGYIAELARAVWSGRSERRSDAEHGGGSPL
jgi:TRAP-type C4-dicarboxylate transport system permease small subunit